MKEFTLKIADLFLGFDFLGSRDSGEKLRNRIIELLEGNDKVILDFLGIDRISHSFADEVFGLLFVYRDLDYIKQHIALQNAQENIRNMANLVIKERLKR